MHGDPGIDLVPSYRTAARREQIEEADYPPERALMSAREVWMRRE